MWQVSVWWPCLYSAAARLLLNWEWKIQTYSSVMCPTAPPIGSCRPPPPRWLNASWYLSTVPLKWTGEMLQSLHLEQTKDSICPRSSRSEGTGEAFWRRASGKRRNSNRFTLTDVFLLWTSRENNFQYIRFFFFFFGPLIYEKQGWSSGFISLPQILKKGLMSAVPEGKCSLIGQLSTCKVALPPFLVNRTKWYLPSLTAVISFTLMSTVPMLKVTPTLPSSCEWDKMKAPEWIINVLKKNVVDIYNATKPSSNLLYLHQPLV